MRPHWLLRKPDRSSFRRLYSDWNGPSGVWWRARVNPTQAAAILKLLEEDHVDRGRKDARALRAEIGKITTFDMVTLDRWTTTFPLNPGGCDRNPVETWRAETMSYYIWALLKPGTASPIASGWSHGSILPPYRETCLHLRDFLSMRRTFLESQEAGYIGHSKRCSPPGRQVRARQLTAQIGSYLVDADLFVTADKVFASIVQRVANEAVMQMAAPVLVSVENCVTTLIKLLRQEPPMPPPPSFWSSNGSAGLEGRH